MTSITDLPRPAFPFITIDDRGRPDLVAQRCTACGSTYADSQRVACARCGAREAALETFTPAHEGTLHSAVIVRRGFPGVEVPFVSAVVDLDGGPTLKGTLRGTRGFEPEDVATGQRVRVCFDDALGRKDKEGNSYVAHYFEPVSA
ncbi:Zn-ribbon domain-containing OB-fold protein [Flavisphingomonas formosensis]|uniref:Zn-ribbon domain-containing OB-fold protein n=1 Tax=Flavisphingomonas formosensis TaxID=861534 RepID=UPI0012FA8E39|nr:OB-fold domain-containing protein [Sphingomonas formosensis]